MLGKDSLQLDMLEPIQARKNSEKLNFDRDRFIADCVKWHNEHSRNSNWVHKLTPKKRRNTEARLEKERRQLLLYVDECAWRISKYGRWEDAVAMAVQVRMCLARSESESGQLLTLWNEPMGTPEEKVDQLMEARLILATATVVKSLCEPPELNIPSGTRQAGYLAKRVECSPLLRNHATQLRQIPGLVDVVVLAGNDVWEFKNDVAVRYHAYIAEQPNVEYEVAKVHFKYVTACIVEMMSIALKLRLVAKDARALQSRIELEKPGPDVQKGRGDAEDALNLLRMRFKYIDFDLSNHEPPRRQFQWADVESLARKWGYGSIDTSMEPAEVGEVMWETAVW